MGKVFSTASVGVVGLAAAMLTASNAEATSLGATHALLSTAWAKAQTTELVAYSCHRVRRCDPLGCGWVRVCRPSCPDPYSCFPLYGAYGPYGGSRYWGAFTYEGWR